MENAELKQVIVKLHVYRGAIRKDENNKIVSESQNMKLWYGITEWELFKKNALILGYSRTVVLSAIDMSGKEPKVLDPIPSVILNDIEMIYKGKEIELTPEQKKMEAMEAEMAEMKALLKGGATPPKKEAVKVEAPKADGDLKKWRDKYQTVLGKKAFNGWTAEQLEAKIEEHAN